MKPLIAFDFVPPQQTP
eukprot:gene26535-biopygen16788